MHRPSSLQQLSASSSSLCRFLARSPWRCHASQSARSVSSHALKTGIVGLPNVGKSTLFNAIVKNGAAQAANFPFCTIEPNTGLCTVPDERLDVLSGMSKSAKTVPATVEYVDIAGLVKGASKGEGLGNQFLANVRECDSLVQVVRCFDDDNIVHVAGAIDPTADTDVINFELILADIAQVERRLDRIAKQGFRRAKNDEEKHRLEAEQEGLGLIQAALEEQKPARAAALTAYQREAVAGLQLLTLKPLTYAANVAEDDLADADSNKYVQALRAVAEKEACRVIVISAQVEAELHQLEAAEAQEYLESLGVSEGGLRALVRATYGQLGLNTYFTTGEQETRAWTFSEGMTAPQCAGIIHSDFEKQFIRAETLSYDDFVACKGFVGAKDAGKARLEGKEYVVREGDVMLFRTGA